MKPDTPEWYEYQYMPRLTVKDAHLIQPAWQKRALETRERLAHMDDIKYGPHPRENLDLYRAPNARGCVVYIHGGYWRSFSKLETSWVADHFVEEGLSVALINYPLCPDVPLAHICDSVQRAFAYLWRSVLTKGERANIVVTGHSAGGHLAALHMATEWTRFNIPAQPFKGVVCLSGVFALPPLLNVSINTELRLNHGSAEALSITGMKPNVHAPLILAVGGDEPGEFHRQSQMLASVWAELKPEVLTLQDTNHYTIVDHLAAKDGPLHRAVLAIARQGAAG
jgi:arylformamidase